MIDYQILRPLSPLLRTALILFDPSPYSGQTCKCLLQSFDLTLQFGIFLFDLIPTVHLLLSHITSTSSSRMIRNRLSLLFLTILDLHDL